MKQLLLLLGLALSGCIASQPSESYIAPKLIDQEPFPALPPNLVIYRQDFHMKLQVGADGTVLHVFFDHWSGDPEWDSIAVQRIRHWRFSPGMYNGTPVKLWVDLHACVRCEEPVMMAVEEIMCPTRQIADSVYTLLRSGSDFETLASACSIAPSRPHGGRLGEVDIHRFPDVVHNALMDIKSNEFTAPLAVGNYYCIYKRVPWDMKVP
jgi:PPIC-type PPIASE domain